MENQNKIEYTEFIHQIPTCLHEYKDGLQFALYYLSYCGKRPAEIPKGDARSVRFSLPPKAVIAINELIPEFGSRTQVITAALAWIPEQSEKAKAIAKFSRPFEL